MITPVAIKVSVATIDRVEPRAIPQTPCPLVQPLPNRLPTPTNTPPSKTCHQARSMTGAAGPLKAATSKGPSTNPITKVNAQDSNFR